MGDSVNTSLHCKELSMSIFMRILLRTGPLAGIGALILGLLNWFFHINFIEIHMLFGFLVTLTLLIVGSVAVFTKGLRVLGVIAIVFALDRKSTRLNSSHSQIS